MNSALNFCTFYRLLILLTLCFLCANPAAAQTGVHCGNDLMKQHRIHIPHATFLRSEPSAEPSQKLCESVYKVPGRFARIAESVLIKKYGMGNLVFECCGWFPKNGKEGTFKRPHYIADGSYASYTISMSSGETLEKNWNKIDYFYITLAIYAI